jgi:hypothetical protein
VIVVTQSIDYFALRRTTFDYSWFFVLFVQPTLNVPTLCGKVVCEMFTVAVSQRAPLQCTLRPCNLESWQSVGSEEKALDGVKTHQVPLLFCVGVC